MRLGLIPSPFVGPSSWRPVARLLPDAVAVDYGGVSGPRWYEDVAERIAAAMGEAPWIAVLRSSAGAFVPGLAASTPALAGLIFVDSVLPYPGRSALGASPAEHAELLRKLTTDGLLAPWSDWFGPGAVERLIPDAEARAEFLADIPRVPFAFLEAEAPVESRWQQLPRCLPPAEPRIRGPGAPGGGPRLAGATPEGEPPGHGEPARARRRTAAGIALAKGAAASPSPAHPRESGA